MNLQDELRVRTQRFPCGYYLLGAEVIDRPGYLTARTAFDVKRWSNHWFGTLMAGEARELISTTDRVAKCFSVHAWGLCRLVAVRVGPFMCNVGSALFVDVEHVIEPGFALSVTLQAFDFEPLAAG